MRQRSSHMLSIHDRLYTMCGERVDRATVLVDTVENMTCKRCVQVCKREKSYNERSHTEIR